VPRTPRAGDVTRRSLASRGYHVRDVCANRTPRQNLRATPQVRPLDSDGIAGDRLAHHGLRAEAGSCSPRRARAEVARRWASASGRRKPETGNPPLSRDFAGLRPRRSPPHRQESPIWTLPSGLLYAARGRPMERFVLSLIVINLTATRNRRLRARRDPTAGFAVWRTEESPLNIWRRSSGATTSPHRLPPLFHRVRSPAKTRHRTSSPDRISAFQSTVYGLRGRQPNARFHIRRRRRRRRRHDRGCRAWNPTRRIQPRKRRPPFNEHGPRYA
jgi:hypothetical protein